MIWVQSPFPGETILIMPLWAMVWRALFHGFRVRGLEDEKDEPFLGLIFYAHGRLKRDEKEFPGPHLAYFIADVESPLASTHRKGHVGIGVMLGNLLAGFKTDLVDLHVLLVHQVGETSVRLEDFLFFEIDDIHSELLSIPIPPGGETPREKVFFSFLS